MLDRIHFALTEAFTALRRNGLMTVSAVNTAAIALFILGGLGFMYVALNAKLDALGPQFEMKISVKNRATKEQVQQMVAELGKTPGVSAVKLLPKEEAWQKYRESHGLLADTKDIENPLPDQVVITLAQLDKGQAVREAIRRQPYFDPVDGIRDAKEERQRVLAMISFVRWSGLILGLIAVFAAGTLILNSVHLTVLARRQEIRIMTLVGANHGTIRWPFLLEGAISGVAGGLLAGLLLWAITAYVTARQIAVLGPLESSDFHYPVVNMVLVLMIVGALMGMAAASLSIRKYLRYAA
jgi:cell division transport system permease protein